LLITSSLCVLKGLLANDCVGHTVHAVHMVDDAVWTYWTCLDVLDAHTDSYVGPHAPFIHAVTPQDGLRHPPACSATRVSRCLASSRPSRVQGVSGPRVLEHRRVTAT